MTTKSHQRAIDEALSSINLTTALDRALPTFRERRAAALESVDFDALRADLTARRRRGVEQLPDLIDRFEREATAAGAVIHRAATIDDACRIVAKVARQREAKLIVKSKSMATEEIGLNAYLQKRGIEVVETDLGEWIIQLASEHPSHLIAPAIHKTREEIAALFRDRFGEEVPPEVADLVKVARRRLRQKFVDADLGISGANCAIAESGTLVIVSNEGNGRLVTTLPPVHIAIVPVDKVVETLDDAVAVLKLLPRSATGQQLSSYVSFITGPSRTGDIELNLQTGVHGPEQVHIVLLDNGRLAMRDDPLASEALRCIRCAACLNACPAFQAVGGHVFGHIYTGPIGIVLTRHQHGLEHAAGPQSLCLGCHACDQVCPTSIPIADLIQKVREEVVEERGIPWQKAAALAAWTSPVAGTLLNVARTLQRPILDRSGFLNIGPLGTAGRLPGLASRTFLSREAGRGRIVPAGPPRVPSSATGVTVAYFPGCITDQTHPATGDAVLRVLEALGVTVIVPAGQRCCGLPATNSGDRFRARQMAEDTIMLLERTDADFIVSSATSCVAAIVRDYPRQFEGDETWSARAHAVGKRMLDFVSFLSRVARIPDGSLAGRPLTVTYHDSCQSFNVLGLSEEPRRLIRDVLGCELREMPESNVCCGFGGSFAIEHADVSSRVFERKLAAIAQADASWVVADNPGCLLQIRGGLHQSGRTERVGHIAELVLARIREQGSAG